MRILPVIYAPWNSEVVCPLIKGSISASRLLTSLSVGYPLPGPLSHSFLSALLPRLLLSANIHGNDSSHTPPQ